MEGPTSSRGSRNRLTCLTLQEHDDDDDKLAKENTNGVPSDQTVGISFFVGKEIIRSHLRQEHLNGWKTCKGCRQSKTLMSEPVPSRIKELRVMSRQKLDVAVGLLTLIELMWRIG